MKRFLILPLAAALAFGTMNANANELMGFCEYSLNQAKDCAQQINHTQLLETLGEINCETLSQDADKLKEFSETVYEYCSGGQKLNLSLGEGCYEIQADVMSRITMAMQEAGFQAAAAAPMHSSIAYMAGYQREKTTQYAQLATDRCGNGAFQIDEQNAIICCN